MSSLEQAIKQKSFEAEEIKANLNVLYTANFLYNRISAFLKPQRLSHEQFNVLRILRGSHPKSLCQKDILGRMIAPKSNLTLIIKKLQDKHWVLVKASKTDKRAYQISITKEGLNKLKTLDKLMQEQRMDFHRLSESEAFHLNALLDKMRS